MATDTDHSIIQDCKHRRLASDIIDRLQDAGYLADSADGEGYYTLEDRLTEIVVELFDNAT